MAFTINGTTGINLGTQPLTGSLPDANAPSGSVLQVVQNTTTSQVDTTSVSLADTGLSASITPLSSSSKILVMANMCGLSKSAANAYMGLRLLRGASTIFLFATQAGFTSSSSVNSWGGDGVNYLDSPATTSSTTYKIQFNNAGLGTVYINDGTSLNGCTITLMEIAA
jgi:hypothetical protein